MTATDSTTIPLSKSKLAKLLLVSSIFLVAGLWILLKDPQVSNPLFNSFIAKTIASYGGLILGTLGVFFFSRKLLDKKPGIVMDEKGICDNTTIFTFGLIPWSDIAGIYESSVEVGMASKQLLVTIRLVDPVKYITRERNIVKRKLMSTNTGLYGSPIHISANGLKASHNELLDTLQSGYRKYGQGTGNF